MKQHRHETEVRSIDLASEHYGRWDLDEFEAILYSSTLNIQSMLDDAGRQASS